jgi:hypothetical protein
MSTTDEYPVLATVTRLGWRALLTQAYQAGYQSGSQEAQAQEDDHALHP